jgi:hypothetical protein
VLKASLASIAALLVAFALVTVIVTVIVTVWALESGGVAVIATHAPEGELRSTHVWYAEPAGELWLEAGTPENPWFTDAQREPQIRFSAEGRSGDYLAEPVYDSEAHTRMRSGLSEKYGWRDRWLGLFVDTTHSVAVRLIPVAPGQDRGAW